MHLGEINDATPLKELTQSFGRVTSRRQPLTLQPSMIPGQGIAQVQVEASPLLRDPIELDFLKMFEAYYTDENNRKQRKTIAYLQTTLPRSFPVDFPDVEASFALYRRHCEQHIREFLSRNCSLPGDCFSHTTWPNVGARGIEAFQRVNVFGTQSGKEFPIQDFDLFHNLFHKIAFTYEITRNEQERRDCIRLAAWTYRCGCREFRKIIENALDRMRQAAEGFSVKPVQQEFTVCANMLSTKQQKEFLRYFNQHASTALRTSLKEQTEVRGVDWWIRALTGILIYSNEVLRDINSTTCEETMFLLQEIWRNYTLHGKTHAYVSRVVCCMLFLLRRRKYDHDFLRDNTSGLYFEIMSMKENLQPHFPLAQAFFEYMENKGSIDIPMGDIMQNARD